jgi:hypothetical protein
MEHALLEISDFDKIEEKATFIFLAETFRMSPEFELQKLKFY